MTKLVYQRTEIMYCENYSVREEKGNTLKLYVLCICHPVFRKKCFVYIARCDKCWHNRILMQQTIDIAVSMLLICNIIDGYRIDLYLNIFPQKSTKQ